MHRCVTVLYYRLFYFMESQGILDPVSERDLFALHYVFLPRINQSVSVLSMKDGITMAFEQNTTGHQINSSHLELYNYNNLD
jgi:hypothetical protein